MVRGGLSRWCPYRSGIALAALLSAGPGLAATHTINSGTVVYPGPYAANDIFIVTGATTVLQIQSGSLPLTNMVDLHDGATVDNAGTITRTGTGNRGVVGGVGIVKNHSGGQITAQDATGVLLYEGGTVENSGEGSLIRGGVRGVSIQAGTASVSNLDGATIESTSESAVYIDAEGSVTNGLGSTIKGKGTGIRAFGDLTVDNYGMIEGIDSDGVSIGNGTVTNSGAGALIKGGDSGVFIDGEGEVLNEDGAQIDATSDGVVMYWGGDVTNSGGARIEAGRTGVVVWDFGTVTNSGEGSLISGDGVGVDFTPFGMSGPFLVINEDGADVVGGYAGVRVWGDESGTPHDGGRVENSGEGSSITAYAYGVFFEDGAIGNVLNGDGALIKSDAGSGVVFYSGGDVTNQGGAKIEANVVGVYSLGGAATVTNSGTGSSIKGASQGIYLDTADGRGTVNNSAGATIAGGGDDNGGLGIWVNGDGDVTNDAATISGDRASGVVISGGGTITNKNGGWIEGDRATHIGGDGTVTNTGSTIKAVAAEAAVTIDGDGNVYNTAAGTIIGKIVIGGDAEIENKGASSTGAVKVTGDATIENSGSAMGDVRVAGHATIDNLAGATMGSISARTAEITNDGATISRPDTAYAIFLEKGGEVTNSNGGRIEGGDIAIYLYENGGTVTNNVGSTIAATTTAIHAFGDTNVVNAGTIEGNVWLEEDASNKVTLMTGSSITGDLYIGHNSTSRLILDGAGTQLYSDAVTNDTVFASTVIKKGSGSWTIDKHIDATVFNIDEGTLILGSAASAGSVAATVYANAGTVVKGSGVIYGNLITEGATIAPGNSPGSLTVVGGYLQDATTVYELEFDRDANLMDQIIVEQSDPPIGDGNAILLAGAKLHVTQLGAGAVAVGTRHSVLKAANHLTGTFTLTGDLTISPFLALEDDYDDNNAYLTVVQTRSLTEAAGSPNQIAVAEALESTPPGNDALAALLSLPDDDAAADALDQLAGGIHSGLRSGLLAATQPLREAALDRLRNTLCAQTASCEAGATLWSRGYGLAMAESGLDIRTGGFLFGADLPGPHDTQFGVFGGTGLSGFGEAMSSDFTLGSYGGVALGDLALRWGAGATAHRVTTERHIVLPGFAETLTAAYPAVGTQAFAEAAYHLAAGPVAFEPFANLAYAGLTTAGFTETGGDAALSVDASSNALLLATLGLAVEADLGGGTLRASAGWQHVIAGGTSDMSIAFAGGDTRRISGGSTAADSLVLGLDLDLALGESATLALGYDGLLAPGVAQHGAKAELRVAF